MTETNAAENELSLTARLARTRLAVRAAMIVERGWPLVLPLLLVVCLFLSLSWLGVFRIMPDMVRLAAMIALGIAALAALYPLRFYRQPTVGRDRPPHRARQQARSTRRCWSRPTGRAARAAPLPKRCGASTSAAWPRASAASAATCRAHAFPNATPGACARRWRCCWRRPSPSPSGRWAAGWPTDSRRMAGWRPIPPRIDAWVTPPAYTGKAPVFLTSSNNAQIAGQTADQAAAQPASSFTVPEGSELSLRVTGGSGEETLSFTDAAGNLREIEPQGAPEGANADPAAPAPTGVAGVRQFAGKLTTDGTLSLKSGDRELSAWTFAVTPDHPPVIRFSGEPKRAVNGALELAYEVEDDYGATEAVAEFALEEPPAKDAHPLYEAPEMKLSLPRRDAKGPAAKTSRDLTEHVWSGSRIKLTLKAKDAAGQEAASETKTFVMPERIFTNPLARAVVEHRRIFSIDANRKQDVLDLIDAITLQARRHVREPVPLSRHHGRPHPARDGRKRRAAARGRRLYVGDGAVDRGRRPLRCRKAAAPGAGGAAAGAGEQRLRRGNRQADGRTARGHGRVPARIRRARDAEPEHGPADACRTARNCARATCSACSTRSRTWRSPATATRRATCSRSCRR